MADALKAEGNKLFAEKKFTESMWVPRKHLLGETCANKSAARSSHKLSSSTLQITCSTQTDRARTPR
jgi:hypothetical protein